MWTTLDKEYESIIKINGNPCKLTQSGSWIDTQEVIFDGIFGDAVRLRSFLYTQKNI